MMVGALRITECEMQFRDEPVMQFRDGPVEASIRTYEVPDLLWHRCHTQQSTERVDNRKQGACKMQFCQGGCSLR
jgi:hypothetical protein